MLSIPIEGASIEPVAPARNPENVEAAREFEAYMLRMLLTQMRKTIGEGGMFEGNATKGYEAILDDALSRRAAEKGSFGLAEQILRQWDGHDGGRENP